MAGGKVTGFWSSLRQLHAIITPAQRRELWTVAALTVAGAVAEVTAIGAVVPFLALLANSGGSAAGSSIFRVFSALGATTEQQQLALATAILCSAAVAAAVLRIFLVRKTQYFANLFGHELSLEVQRRILFQPYIWHTGQNSSRQLAAIEKVQLVTGLILQPLLSAAAATVLIAAVLVVLLQLAPLATIAAGTVLGVAYWIIGAAARSRLSRNSQLADEALERRTRIIQEAAGGIREIILDDSQARVVASFRAADLQFAHALADSSVVSIIPRYILESAGVVVIAIVALVMAERDGGIIAALPLLGALALGAQRLLPLVQQLFQGWSSVAAHSAMIDDLLGPLRLPLPGHTDNLPAMPFAMAIAFDDVGFRFPGRDQDAVAGLSFSIPKGARVALVGRTGSGKSTSADLLMGLLDPGSGRITIDGTTLDDTNRRAWRANIGHVPQMPFLADATIAENIALSSEPDTDRVRQAAKQAQLSDFIDSLPAGYATHVGERGARLSGGQRQRLAIARAIYKDAPLLVLDEATSALDDETERAIAGALDGLQARGTTVVIIAHRSSMIAGCDQVIRLDGGRIAGTEAQAASLG
ncbi:ABC transporter ATP-binding protein/permease [Sphingomonas sabuli]|uniref:ABC transporter ATP-binding protein/permease n=1 Tax=Sphingomonas sabuli TaxID=2764186 RepID=A0A7G9L455_9SPHN|nr:ABC transporter ATP-binding protein/permease [Sphingomonas sabuli]QNM83404.1 ABC transporter ATP-binding protein/permease [Sphingomonas sabuli]